MLLNQASRAVVIRPASRAARFHLLSSVRRQSPPLNVDQSSPYCPWHNCTMALPPLWKGCCLPFSFNRNADCPWYNGTSSWLLSGCLAKGRETQWELTHSYYELWIWMIEQRKHINFGLRKLMLIYIQCLGRLGSSWLQTYRAINSPKSSGCI
ncbi:hypothetical protein V6N12_023754 [Hibiscus sabdariffa]|uniref:Uncharacterized protein n=1 Tax=Hibiscus sabdariffa TaxID=183260 RepID=A0ABR2FYL1_9ROSI